MKITFNEEIAGALHFERPIVALESTVISHGLPQPRNLDTALRLEQIVRQAGAIPATIAMFGGEVFAGLSNEQLELLATAENIRKLSRRDLAIAAAQKLNGATTVATTALIAHAAGFNVFATGGIGGVHRGFSADISADLPELARTPIIVVCSGAKAILDLPATREWLETHGVAVLGWKTDKLPAFYSSTSDLDVDEPVETAAEVSQIADARREMGLESAIIVAVPVPEESAIAQDEIETLIDDALAEATAQGVAGKSVTPFLLNELAQRSGGKTLAANIALLENNARVGAEIAKALNY
ncbi:MAG TPA: pseudouridine-5'-phosphate glycosidase [Pyrinomonadaceae bacterium]|nr:pseudouridine-5'-phosphate glycosidase [Pyrinomonadaceae bacterium]